MTIGYEAVVINATDYYPFGMQMPGRHGFATESGDWHGSYAYSTPAYLTVNHRNANTPTEYVASVEIELDNGFLTGAGSDNFVAYIADSAMMAALDSAYQLVGNGYRYGYQGYEKDNEISGDGNHLSFADYGYDPRTARRWQIDPMNQEIPYFSPYIFCSNSPISKLDPDGKWDVSVHAYSDRAKSGYALLVVKDNKGIEVYRTVVKTIGTGGTVRNAHNANTPQGNYKITGWRKTGEGTGYNRVSFGPNDLLGLDYQGGEGGNRNGMHVHGGRQEGKYKGRKDLASTHGCMRINDEDIKTLKVITKNLEINDQTEKAGKLIVKDDLKNPVKYDANRENAGLDQFPKSSSKTESTPKLDIAPTFIDNTFVTPPVITLPQKPR